MSEFSPELTRAIEDYELRVSPDLKTVTGRLKYGIGVIDGEMHHDFAMHLLQSFWRTLAPESANPPPEFY